MSEAYIAATIEWAYRWDRCWRCGRRGVWKNGLEIHHFVRGCHRQANDLATTSMLCCACHGSEPGLLEMLRLKRACDRAHYSLRRVNLLRNRSPLAITEADVDAKG